MVAKKQRPKPLTDAERLKRFLDMTTEVGASDSPKAFDRAFKQVATKRQPPKKT
jgi:hypothetical protein